MLGPRSVAKQGASDLRPNQRPQCSLNGRVDAGAAVLLEVLVMPEPEMSQRFG